jgi:hypothetical protein
VSWFPYVSAAGQAHYTADFGLGTYSKLVAQLLQDLSSFAQESGPLGAIRRKEIFPWDAQTPPGVLHFLFSSLK